MTAYMSNAGLGCPATNRSNQLVTAQCYMCLPACFMQGLTQLSRLQQLRELNLKGCYR